MKRIYIILILLIMLLSSCESSEKNGMTCIVDIGNTTINYVNVKDFNYYKGYWVLEIDNENKIIGNSDMICSNNFN